MVNCNPETVSTDYDTADRLYFEPLTFEDVLEVVEAERAAGPVAGVICTLGGQTPLGLAQRLKDAGVPVLGTSPEAIDDAEHRGRLLPGAARHRPARPEARHGDDVRRGPRDRRRRSATRCWSGPPTCSAAAGMEIVYDDATLEAYIAKATDVSPDAPGAGRPVPGGRRRDRRRRALRRHRPLPRRRHGAHRGGRHPLRRLGVRAAADHAGLGRPAEDPGGHREAGRPDRGARADERPVRDQGRHPLRDRGQPPGQPHGAVRLQGDGGAAGQGRGPDRGGGDRSPTCATAGVLPATGDGTDLPEDAPIAVKEAVLPFHRFRTVEGHGVDTVLGAGDEVHRRGHGPGRRVRHGVREVAGRRVRLAADRGHGVRLAGQPGQALGGLPDQAAGRPRLPGAGHRRHRAGAAPQRRALRGGRQVQRRARATCVERILAGDVDIVVNTPFGSPGNSGPRLDGYEIRTAAVAAGIPCITTVQGMAAAVQGIEALRRGDIGVRSLQDVHAALPAPPRGTA